MFLLGFYGLQPMYKCPKHTPMLTPHSSFLKRSGSPNIPIQAIGLSLYENLGQDGPVEEPGTKVTRTQWLDLSSLEMSNLVGKNILIVDEVDDTRTTLEYAVKELQKDVETARLKLGKEGEKTKFSIFVLHVSSAGNGDCYILLNDSLEQGQDQEGPLTGGYDEGRAVFGCEDRRRRLDMLSLGGDVRTDDLSQRSPYTIS